MTVHGPRGDASNVCAQDAIIAKHKGRSGSSSTQEIPHVFVEEQTEETTSHIQPRNVGN